MGKYFNILSFLYVLTYLRSFEAVNVNCNFNMYTYTAMGSAYRCEVTTNLNIKTPEDAVIIAVSGTHLSGKTNNDVLNFDTESKVIEYFPKGLEKFFKNLKAIRILNGRLKQISQSDLKPILYLDYLNVGTNNIEILEDGLFDNHPNMKVIVFSSNKIFHVGKNIFNFMNKITWLNFGSNTCINLDAQSNSNAAQVIIQSLKIKCFDAKFANFSQILANLENESKTLTFNAFPIWSKTLAILESEFKNSRFSYLISIKERFEVLNVIKIEDFPEYLISKFEDLENNLSKIFTETSMKDEFFKVNEKLLEHSSEVRSELIKNDVQHLAILSRIASLEENLELIKEKLSQVLDAVIGN